MGAVEQKRASSRSVRRASSTATGITEQSPDLDSQTAVTGPKLVAMAKSTEKSGLTRVLVVFVRCPRAKRVEPP